MVILLQITYLYKLSFYTATFNTTTAAASQVRALVYDAFIENGIEIPYDRVQVDILSDKKENSE